VTVPARLHVSGSRHARVMLSRRQAFTCALLHQAEEKKPL
jgi:hypothetical protein